MNERYNLDRYLQITKPSLITSMKKEVLRGLPESFTIGGKVIPSKDIVNLMFEDKDLLNLITRIQQEQEAEEKEAQAWRIEVEPVNIKYVQYISPQGEHSTIMTLVDPTLDIIALQRYYLHEVAKTPETQKLLSFILWGKEQGWLRMPTEQELAKFEKENQ